MDPSAPDKTNPQNPSQGQPEPNPILPGQYVVTGADTPQPAAAPAAAAPQPPPQPQAQSPQNLAPAQPAPGLGPLPQTNPVPTAQAAPFEQAPTQPDPAPFVPPGQPPTAPDPQGAPPPGDSKFAKFKPILLAVGAMILIGAIGFGAWFFVLGKKTGNEAKKETNVQVSDPSPLPKRTDGGFGDIPQATSGATDSAVPDPGLTTP